MDGSRGRPTRRRFLHWTASAGSGLLVATWAGAGLAARVQDEKKDEAGEHEPEADRSPPEVGAVEDLMREHGVLRRCLLVYAEVAIRLRHPAAAIPAAALEKTARLFRTFGEDYHERKLEEEHIFPAVRRAGGPAAAYPDVLAVQHRRGREMTDDLLGLRRGNGLRGNAEALATQLEAFVRMYQNHAAREDTIVFPAWKETLSAAQYQELGEQFEEIEHQQFGDDGFEEAVREVERIEDSLGLADLAQFTAPPLK